jgi:hypothetical protein
MKTGAREWNTEIDRAERVSYGRREKSGWQSPQDGKQDQLVKMKLGCEQNSNRSKKNEADAGKSKSSSRTNRTTMPTENEAGKMIPGAVYAGLNRCGALAPRAFTHFQMKLHLI